jgi:hypothetical protein
MLDGIVSILTGSIGGSLIGMVGGFLNRKEERKKQKEENDHTFRMVKENANAEQQGSEARAFEESQKSLSPKADFIKSLVRPVITFLLLYQCYLILTSLEAITGGLESLPVDMTLDLYKTIVLNIISLTATAVNWWFASRPASRK